MKAYKYKLTSSNRHLANFFEGVIVDEKNSILWSDQDLTYFCGEVWKRNKLIMLCISIPTVIAFWTAIGLLAACKLFPPIKEFAWDAERRINIAIMQSFYKLP